MNFKIIAVVFCTVLQTVADLKSTEKFLTEVKLPEGKFAETTLEELVEFLRSRSVELDPEKKGININVLGDFSLINSDDFSPFDDEAVIFLRDFSVKEITYRDFFDQVTKGSNYTYSVTSLGVVLQPKDFKPLPTPLADALAPEIKKELQAVVLPKVKFQNCTIAEAAQFFSLRSQELMKDGPSFQVTKAAHWKGDKLLVTKRFSAKAATLGDLLDFFAKSFHLDYEVKGHTIIFSQAREEKTGH